MSNSIGVGVVGYGYAGRAFHSYLVNLADGLHLHGVMARREEQREQAQRERHCKTFATIDDMLADDEVGLVVIATPHDSHCELAIRAMRAGRHVVTDKIICMTTDEADRMIEEAQKQNVLFSVFHNRRWDGDFLTIKQIIDQKRIGDLMLVEECIYGYGNPRTWRGQMEKVGSCLFDWGAHLIDQALLTVRSPVERVVGTAQFMRPEFTVESWARCQIHFANDAVWVVEQSNSARVKKPHWLVLGTQGSLVKHGVDPQEDYMKREEIENAVEDPADRAQLVTENGDRDVVETLPGDWRKYYQNIADVLLRGADLAVKPEECRRALRILTAYLESIKTGQAVVIEDDIVV